MKNQAPKLWDEQRLFLLEQARASKMAPGVYLMKDSGDEILYIGKAKILKNRLISYFQSTVHEIPRIEMMIRRVERFEVILTLTEAEALILEATLVKKYQPKFNIRLKDDKAYPYLKIRTQEPFPRLEWTRKVLLDGAEYFGPFPSSWSARQVLQLLTEVFQLRDCSDNVFRYRSRACILHQMGRCSGSCVGLVSQKQYHEAIRRVIQVLEGRSDEVIQILKKSMQEASSLEEYERAGSYRDQIQNLEIVTQTQGAVDPGSQRNRDVIGIAFHESQAHGAILRIRLGKMVAVEHYDLQNFDSSFPVSKLLSDLISQYYLLFKPLSEDFEGSPLEILVPEAPHEIEVLEQAIGVVIKIAETETDKEMSRQLLSVAHANAEYALEQKKTKTQGHGLEALEEVQEKLQLQGLPHRIECFDISNIQGKDAVASRVVFIDGAPEKSLYRRYKIKTVEGANDFAMMREVLGRRFSRSEERLPDLVVVDGGKGQLAQAVAIFEELSIQGVDVVGLAKARVEKDFQAKEIRSSQERIFISGVKDPKPLLPHTKAFNLLTHIRDEAHRFAIHYHRVLRSKKANISY